MNPIRTLAFAAAFLSLTSVLPAASVAERLTAAIQIANDKQGSMNPIPQALINNAKAVAIVKVAKAGLVFGGSGGQGIVIKRIPGFFGSSWSAPSAFNMSGGSFGAQIGYETKSFIILINTEDALKLFTSDGKTKWDATAAGTLGGDTVRQSQSELAKLPILIYQTSSGVFGGATFGGTSIGADLDANRKAYGNLTTVRDILGGKVKAPAGADALYKILNGKR